MTETRQTERPLRIVIGADMFSPEINGAARFAERLAAQLVKRGHEVHIIAPGRAHEDGVHTEIIEGAPMTVHRLKSLRWYPHETYRFAAPFGLRKRMRQILTEVKPDIVHLQSHVLVGRALAPEARAMNIPFMATNHFMPENLVRFSMIPEFLQGAAFKYAWKDLSRVYAGARAITTPTVRAAELLEKSSGLKNVLAISCGLDAKAFATDRVPGANGEHHIIFVGRLNPEKRIEVLLRAVGKLDKSLKVQVDLVGDGDQRKHLGQIAKQLDINVHFLGHVSEEELPKTYAAASVFVMPSIAELQSIATMEAMASGLPVIAANAMALPHLCHDGVNGYLFTADDVDDLAAKLKEYFYLPQQRVDDMSAASKQIVSAHDINKTVLTFEKLYRGEPLDHFKEYIVNV